jgi:hypothetical protein
MKEMKSKSVKNSRMNKMKKSLSESLSIVHKGKAGVLWESDIHTGKIESKIRSMIQ